jgi:hypothetical protein
MDPVSIPSDSPWMVGADLNILSNNNESIVFYFNPGFDAINLDLDFGVCGVVSYSDP